MSYAGPFLLCLFVQVWAAVAAISASDNHKRATVALKSAQCNDERHFERAIRRALDTYRRDLIIAAVCFLAPAPFEIAILMKG